MAESGRVEGGPGGRSTWTVIYKVNIAFRFAYARFYKSKRIVRILLSFTNEAPELLVRMMQVSMCCKQNCILPLPVAPHLT